jgi:hypothetical protein
MWGLIVWLCNTVSLTLVRFVPVTHFLYFQKLALQHVFEKEVNDHAKKAARFFIACQPDPATKVKATKAMWAREYSDCKSDDLMLQMQVPRAIQKIKGEVSLCPKAAAAHLVLPWQLQQLQQGWH